MFCGVPNFMNSLYIDSMQYILNIILYILFYFFIIFRNLVILIFIFNSNGIYKQIMELCSDVHRMSIERISNGVRRGNCCILAFAKWKYELLLLTFMIIYNVYIFIYFHRNQAGAGAPVTCRLLKSEWQRMNWNWRSLLK